MQWFSNFSAVVFKTELVPALPGRLVTTLIARPTPRVSEAVGLGGICTSNQFPDDAHAANPGPYFENH